MRKFLRHPADIPIHCRAATPRELGDQQLRNVGQGGLCFISGKPLDPGTAIDISIRLYGSPFEAEGVVIWCRRAASAYEVGVRFHDEQTEFAVRMVEQACHIEHYRREVSQRDGRRLSFEEAAEEWICRYAGEFPV